MNETIKRLKELREKATQGEWHEEEFGEFREDDDLKFALALVNHFPDLLTYIEELERKVAAGDRCRKVLLKNFSPLQGRNQDDYIERNRALRAYEEATEAYRNAK